MKKLICSILCSVVILAGSCVGLSRIHNAERPCVAQLVDAGDDIESTVHPEKSVSRIRKARTRKVRTHNAPVTPASRKVTVTCYQPVAAQCNADYLHTADMSFINLNSLKAGKVHWVAISQDMCKDFPMGSKVRLTDKTGNVLGTYWVHDKMNRRWKNRVDILIHPSDKTRIYWENIHLERV